MCNIKKKKIKLHDLAHKPECARKTSFQTHSHLLRHLFLDMDGGDHNGGGGFARGRTDIKRGRVGVRR